MAKRWRKYIAAFGFGMFLLSAGTAGAMETYYLNNDPTLPMIQDTGVTNQDGRTGLFMDLSTLSIEGIFKDGLATKVTVWQMETGKVSESRTLHVRYADTGKAWVLRTDGKWQETAEGSEDPASMAVHFVKQEMGNDARRDDFMGQIEKLAIENPGEPPSIVPTGVVSLASVKEMEKTEKVAKAEKPAKAEKATKVTKATKTAKAEKTAKTEKQAKVEKTKKAAASPPKKSVVKLKKETQKKTAEPKEDVVVTITPAPKVEITQSEPVKVSIT